jgi:hypothetical protein
LEARIEGWKGNRQALEAKANLNAAVVEVQMVV